MQATQSTSQAGERTQKSLSRAEVNRRIQTLTVSPWGNLSGVIQGIVVHAWATQKNRRIERISVDGIPTKTNAAKTFALSKQLKQLTGLTVHFHFGQLSKTF